MWKALVAGTAASVIAGSSLLFAQQPPAPATAIPPEAQHDQDDDWSSAEYHQDNDWQSSREYDQDGWQPSAEDISAFTDARIAALKAGLRLTPDQEKNWPAFESAVRDMAKARAERWAMHQEEQPSADPVDWLEQPTHLVKQRQVLKSSPMPRGHSIKVSMTRRNIALSFSRRNCGRIGTSPAGLAGMGETGVPIRTVDGDTHKANGLEEYPACSPI
jgi:hypothetical protein